MFFAALMLLYLLPDRREGGCVYYLLVDADQCCRFSMMVHVTIIIDGAALCGRFLRSSTVTIIMYFAAFYISVFCEGER